MSIKVPKYFPIISDTSCRTKWAWSTIILNNGTTSSCCRASTSLIGENFDDFHNTEKKIKSRELMLKGLWPADGCETCESIEKAGGFSDRQFQNQIPDIYPVELDSNLNATRVSPSILEVFFSNACNLKCVYCSAKYSSSIQSENKKFGGAIIEKNNFEYQDNLYHDLVPKFWNWFSKNSNKLQRLQVLGGEPFVQEDLQKLIVYLSETAHPDLEFNIVTNLSLPYRVMHPQLQQLSTTISDGNLKRVDIQVSVDCWGESQEYIRKGFNCNIFESNMKSLIGLNSFRIGLLSTITSLSIPSMLELTKKFKEWNNLQTVFWYMHLVSPSNTSIFSPTIFDFDIFESHLLQIGESFPNDTWDDRITRDTFFGIVSNLEKNCKNDPIKQRKLLEYLQENDRRRNSNWRKTFPWLVNILEKNNVV